MVIGVYKPWSFIMNRKTLWCPEGCFRKNNENDANFCCSCKGKSDWELPSIFPNISYSRLTLELEDLQGQKSCLLNIHKSNDYCHGRPNCKCRCISQPNRRRLFIDCSNQSCEEFPDAIPGSSFEVEMDMSNNKISTLKTKDYFSRVKILDLSENPVTVIDENVDRLNHTSHIFIPNHSLETLPKSVQLLHPDIFRFGKSGIPCNCDNIWIGDWRIYNSASEEFPLFCSNFNNTVFENWTLEIGNCEPYTNGMYEDKPGITETKIVEC
ncbi:SLIT2 [Mytilus edulis]|uniref:SLIT2 n=1 Tax=Mytilus edulis TaxID=6550 RepID=A0A8S3T2P1_MYTED|nr:SLIT2 [Mytilus edulis]